MDALPLQSTAICYYRNCRLSMLTSLCLQTGAASESSPASAPRPSLDCQESKNIRNRSLARVSTSEIGSLSLSLPLAGVSRGNAERINRVSRDQARRAFPIALYRERVVSIITRRGCDFLRARRMTHVCAEAGGRERGELPGAVLNELTSLFCRMTISARRAARLFLFLSLSFSVCRCPFLSSPVVLGASHGAIIIGEGSSDRIDERAHCCWTSRRHGHVTGVKTIASKCSKSLEARVARVNAS